MSEEKLDCRGMACPNPVLKTKEVIDRGYVSRMTVLVDNAAAMENVSRYLTRSGYQVSATEQNGDFAVTGALSNAAPAQALEKKEGDAQELKIAVLVGANYLGRGDDELGRKLMASFLATLREMGQELWRVIFLNSGVKLTVEGSEVLPNLQELEKAGVSVLVCGTCLNHYGILEKKLVGETTNMLDIVTALQLADKVISMT
jgi:selenium metabolism protein YedF